MRAGHDQFQRIRALIGDEEFRALCAKFRGQRLYVPAKMGAHHPIAAVIGHTAAKKLAREFGGERLEELPRPFSRRRLIAELKRKKLTVEQIRQQAGCSRRRVQQVLAEIRDEASDAQPSLFPDD